MLSFNALSVEPRRVLTPAPRATVFVVDDDVLVRESMKRLIRSAGWSAEAFASAREFLCYPRTDGPSCLVLDVNLPDQSGLDLQVQLTQMDRAMPVIFVTGSGDVATTVRAMKAGAVDFLTKPFVGEDLLRAIGQAISRSEARRQHDEELQSLRARYVALTPRERQVMGLVISGLLNKQVGDALSISEITVKAHRGQVMRKMAADSLADLVRMADRLQLHPVKH